MKLIQRWPTGGSSSVRKREIALRSHPYDIDSWTYIFRTQEDLSQLCVIMLGHRGRERCRAKLRSIFSVTCSAKSPTVLRNGIMGGTVSMRGSASSRLKGIRVAIACDPCPERHAANVR